MRTTFLHRLRMCYLLLRTWGEVPHWRLGQLIINASGSNTFNCPDSTLESHMWYIRNV